MAHETGELSPAESTDLMECGQGYDATEPEINKHERPIGEHMREADGIDSWAHAWCLSGDAHDKGEHQRETNGGYSG